MQEKLEYDDVMVEVVCFLWVVVDWVVEFGVGCYQIMIDFGIGFGKLLDYNF